MSSSRFKSTNNKKIIRVSWNLPLLRFLTELYGKKLLYFGLPSPSAEDVIDWIDYIEKVIAFQCRDYPNPSDPNQSDEAIRVLEQILTKLRLQRKLDDFVIYDGYIEEVIVNGKDNDNLHFELNEFVTLYNLDFCNEITSPRLILNEHTSKEEEIYKLHILKKIIDLQSSNNHYPESFILFFTVTARFWFIEAKEYIQVMKEDQILNTYLESLADLKPIERDARILKVYMFNTLSSIFTTNFYIPEFLPVIKYIGSNNHVLTQFTVICTHERTVGRSALIRQNITDFLKSGFYKPNRNRNIMDIDEIDGIDEEFSFFCPIDCFKETKTYKEFWEK